MYYNAEQCTVVQHENRRPTVFAHTAAYMYVLFVIPWFGLQEAKAICVVEYIWVNMIFGEVDIFVKSSENCSTLAKLC